ncbi:putative nuclear transcription factor X-box binding [Tripterygium wilfordii]|uniref:Putative nuclear transcription factor X-box binding n=1 Tax=Tripterygium wilfordii TaxID=458696 RepID=A0A7J7E284_TRIWF|nr:NF-X1-type zinc finger protein NFXL2 [Tripterygium wilfordii]KAF5752574.1 putative nuclear transcription factor X-box binding [Tripterygium wilfordii]
MTSANHPAPLSESDSDSDHGDSQLLHHNDLTDSIFKSYFESTSQSKSSSSINSFDLSKIQSFLTSSSSGALSCLICLERIRLSDPTWSCTSSCYAVFHLFCIQSWARQSSDLSASRAATRLPISPDKAAESSIWNCPKCRSEYPKSGIPKTYYCFCGKLENPPSDNPWILPHSCGEICSRPLRHNCGHFCLLLCHPGPCPSCPKLIKAKCYCGSVEDVKRCGFKDFSCNNVCSKTLDCKIHRCTQICHDGPCPPCYEMGVYRCRCGKSKEERECFERDYRCENSCERLLGCGKHWCDTGCHRGECGECPLQGKRTCPCGKRFYEGMPCDVQVPLCGATCDKLLGCRLHQCPERCHRGPCVETCRIVVRKACRCGGLKKEVPCHQDLACERKCQRVRDCGRHACKRKCCDGDCPPCSEICDKRLRCKNHKCPSPCHRGPCAPCPVMVTISCACGQTRFEVPCGTEMDQKPPRCRKLCSITPLCRHASTCKPHKCHYGGCPTCRLLCEEEYPCGHNCKLRCHGPTPPPNPEFSVKPKKKKLSHQTEGTPGSPCPPCPELVWRPCVGRHIGSERMMVCSNIKQFSCENLCGNPLPCGNHYCTKTCHALSSPSTASTQHKRSQLCEDCNLNCQKEREPPCQHPCPQPCHPGDCHPCKVLVKRSCHCGSMVHVFECIYYNTLSKKEQMVVRSCGGPCHRKLPYCTHLCPETCHPGECSSPDKCRKKVTIRCKCQTLKKEQLCQDVQATYRRAGCDPKDVSKNQFGIGLLPCNSDCKSKVQVVDPELNLRRSKPLEEKESDTEKHVPKRRRRRERFQEPKQLTRFQNIVATVKRLLLLFAILLLLVAVAYYGYHGLMKLSDWMNEVEEQQQRRRPLRI